jgi:hypothetical protein
MDKILQAIHDELVLSYTQAGRVVPTTVAVVAAALMDAIKFSDDEEVHESFKRARMMADVPTQRVLNESLTNYRAEYRAYIAAPEVPRIEHSGSKLVSNAETEYIKATQRLCGIFFGIDEERAREIVTEFEADPRNKEMVEYQRGWLKNNAKALRAKLDAMART